jgi:hypothetical protein
MTPNKSRVLLKLGKETVGYKLVTDIVSSDGRLLAPKGGIIDQTLVDNLLKEGISVVLIEPKSASKAREMLDHMFSRHLDDPCMVSLYKAAVSLVDTHDAEQSHG